MIPALQNAEFVKYGVMHRNTFIDSTELLDASYNLKGTNVFFAGQISGVEGYVESISSGLVAGLNACAMYNKKNSDKKENTENILEKAILNGEKIIFDSETIIGSLAKYISTPHEKFEPMNANFGLLNTEKRFKSKQEKYEFFANKSLEKISVQIN